MSEIYDSECDSKFSRNTHRSKNGGSSSHSSTIKMIEEQNRKIKEFERAAEILYPNMKVKRKQDESIVSKQNPPYIMDESRKNPEDILYPTMKNKGDFAPNNQTVINHMNTQLGGGVFNEHLPLMNYLYKQSENDMNRTSTNKIDNRVFSSNAWEKAKSFIFGAEDFKSNAYKPTKNDKWTIGYGHTEGVKEGDTITKEHAEELYKQDFIKHSEQLKYVKIPLNDNEKIALTSFIYNVGAGAFKNSTLLKKLNQGDKQGAAEEFGKWVNQNGKPLRGLIERRQKEKDLFLTPAE